MDEEAIRKQAKAIMDDFVRALERVGDLKEGFGIERDEFVRKPKKCTPDSDFRGRMLGNAPKTRGDYILTERKKW